MNKQKKTNAFLLHAKPEALVQALGEDIQGSLSSLTKIAAKGPLALLGSGFTPKALGEVAREALAAGAHHELADLCDELGGHGAEVALALSQAFEASHVDGSFHQWDPASSYVWADFIQLDEAAAAVWMRSLGLKIDRDDFWERLEETLDSWSDAKSLLALEDRCVAFSTQDPRLPLGLAMRVTPEMVGAMARGFSQLGQWQGLGELISSLEEAEPEQKTGPAFEAKATLIAQSAAACAKQSPNGNAIDVLCRLCSLAPHAGRLMISQALDVPFDLKNLPGHLGQPRPAESTSYSYSIRWIQNTHARLQEPAAKAIKDMPSLNLSLGELCSLWSDEPGASVARAAGAKPTARSERIGRTLRAMESASSPEARSALAESLGLEVHIAQPNLSKKSTRV